MIRGYIAAIWYGVRGFDIAWQPAHGWVCTRLFLKYRGHSCDQALVEQLLTGAWGCPYLSRGSASHDQLLSEGALLSFVHPAELDYARRKSIPILNFGPSFMFNFEGLIPLCLFWLPWFGSAVSCHPSLPICVLLCFSAKMFGVSILLFSWCVLLISGLFFMCVYFTSAYIIFSSWFHFACVDCGFAACAPVAVLA